MVFRLGKTCAWRGGRRIFIATILPLARYAIGLSAWALFMGLHLNDVAVADDGWVGILRAFDNASATADSDSDGIPDAWEQQHVGNLSTMTEDSDWDGDGVPDRLEYLAGTDPTNRASCLAMRFLSVLPSREVVVGWSGVTNRCYDIVRTTGSLSGSTTVVATAVQGMPPMNVFTDQTAFGTGPFFYHVEVNPGSLPQGASDDYGRNFGSGASLTSTHSGGEMWGVVNALTGDDRFMQLFDVISWPSPSRVQTLMDLAVMLLDNPRYGSVQGVQSTYLGANGDAALVLAIVRGHRGDLETFSGVRIPPTLNPVQVGYSQQEIGAAANLMFGLVVSPSYTEASLSAFLGNALGLDRALEAGGLRQVFADLFAIAPGTQSTSTNPQYRCLIGDIVAASPYSQTAFIAGLPGASLLHAGLAPLRAEFALLYGIAAADQNPTVNGAYRAFLYNTSEAPGYSKDQFLSVVRSAAALHGALGGTNQNLVTVFGIPVAAQNPATNAVYRKMLCDIVGDPQYEAGRFLAVLPLAAALHKALGETNQDVVILYGVPAANQDPAVNPACRQLLFDIVGDPQYEAGRFLAVLPQAAALHTALGGRNEDVAATFGVSVTDQNPVTNPAYRKLLFDIVGDPHYEQSVFLAWLAEQPW